MAGATIGLPPAHQDYLTPEPRHTADGSSSGSGGQQGSQGSQVVSAGRASLTGDAERAASARHGNMQST
ncbi:hypothetical protein EYF80_042766 [Liparis tanakae]|uniref:Uncharacterized protein n=1 Tax=Liparis tanakae TaxID=230148 RepID=A0A4Z2G2B1_9TELE|nr:hypothetical protein EYF80_042766 [Liparis tanakae]